MRYLTRSTMLFSTLMLGWMNIPAQGGLITDNQNLWPVMSQHFTISSETDKEGVQRQINADLKHPRYLKRLARNARPYVYYVYQETEKKHMPAELALLPMIESDYMPKGSSSVGAAGLWQLMPETANNYGIQMNAFYDGRRSITVSTKAALNFLSYLYDQFDHNWLLALAAYNAGPGTVLAAIHHNQARGLPTNFWSLSLPKETEVYVPKLLALAAIIQHPGTYGVRFTPVPNAPVASPVTIKKQMPIATIATLAHTSVSTVKKLNPALKKSVTPPHQTVTLMIPIEKKENFVKQLKAQKTTPAPTIAAQQKQTVSAPVTTSQPSTSLAILKEISHIQDGLIIPHHTTTAPTPAPVAKTHPVVAIKTPTTKSLGLTHHYTVRAGDNLRVLARRFHTTIPALMHANHLRHSHLKIHQHIVV